MTQVKAENLYNNINPIDMVEEVVLSNGWDYEVDENKNIHVEVGGNWCDYQLSYGLNDKGNIIFLSCALDIKVSKHNSGEIYKLLTEINQKYLSGILKFG